MNIYAYFPLSLHCLWAHRRTRISHHEMRAKLFCKYGTYSGCRWQNAGKAHWNGMLHLYDERCEQGHEFIFIWLHINGVMMKSNEKSSLPLLSTRFVMVVRTFIDIYVVLLIKTLIRNTMYSHLIVRWLEWLWWLPSMIPSHGFLKS